jgi:hypothetical protein
MKARFPIICAQVLFFPIISRAQEGSPRFRSTNGSGLATETGLPLKWIKAGGSAIPEKLTPVTFEAIKARASLTPEDLAWQKVKWRDGFLEGLVDG